MPPPRSQYLVTAKGVVLQLGVPLLTASIFFRQMAFATRASHRWTGYFGRGSVSCLADGSGRLASEVLLLLRI
jgi:hypothetical protein